MDTQSRTGRVIRLLSPNEFHIKDEQTGEIIVGELVPEPSEKGFYTILKNLSECPVSYQIVSNSSKSTQKTKINISLDGKPLKEFFTRWQSPEQCQDRQSYAKDQIIQCYIYQISCLKLGLIMLDNCQSVQFYFSDLKLVNPDKANPKEIWEKTSDYFQRKLLGCFVQIKINGIQSYREEQNIFGEILYLHNGNDIRQQILSDGFVQLSKNADKYLEKTKLTHFQSLVQESKRNRVGLWKQQVIITKGSNQVVEHKYRQWEQWIKNNMKYPQIKSADQQIKNLTAQLRKNCTLKPDPNKCRIIVETVMTILQDYITESNIKLLEQFVKVAILALISLQTTIIHNTENIEFLKYLNKLMIVILFFVLENEKLGNKNKMIANELDKIMKIIFKCAFIGNQTFHEKVFDKRKQLNFNSFEFDQMSLSGYSSYSQYSQTEEGDNFTKQSKLKKKISSAQTKIRINSTFLISNIFKNFPSIVENHWQICVKSNILTNDFINYLQNLKISAEPIKMTVQQKKQIASLMRTNFGDCSLVLLTFFEQNQKVKQNALHCMINMLHNLQSRKLLQRSQTNFIQKVLKNSKTSSFNSKFYILTCALRNALYFMLFSLHHEPSIQIIMQTFKTLTELCENSAVIDKIGFNEGMGLLVQNYLLPLINFPWGLKQLWELKALAVEFLAALVDSQKKWEQLQKQYLISENQKNINFGLIGVLQAQIKKKQPPTPQFSKIILQITKYFRNLAKKYYLTIFHEISPQTSIWTTTTTYYLSHPHPLFTSFIKQLLKCHWDQQTQLPSPSPPALSLLIPKAQQYLKVFIPKFISTYSQLLNPQNYVSLINALTYMDYNCWNDSQYITVRQFLIHCFTSFSENGCQCEQYPKLDQLKNQPLVRLYLIKLLGYMSFCPSFHTSQFSQLCLKTLLNLSLQNHPNNTMSKIVWGLSNWLNVNNFGQGLTNKEIQNIVNVLVRMSSCQGQKIGSNCTRGLGFFLKGFEKERWGLDLVQKSKNAIIRNLKHSVLKVRTNSTKTLRSVINNDVVWTEKDMEKIEELMDIFEENILKNNFHLQMETVLLIKDLGNPIPQERMLKVYSYILSNLSIMDYQFQKHKVEKKLRKLVLKEMIKYPKIISEKQEICTQLCLALKNYFLDAKKQSMSQSLQQKKIFEKGFSTDQQTRTMIFEKDKADNNEEKQIVTKVTLQGIQYEAQEDDLELLKDIKQFSEILSQQNNQQATWKLFSEIQISGHKVSLGKLD